MNINVVSTLTTFSTLPNEVTAQWDISKKLGCFYYNKLNDYFPYKVNFKGLVLNAKN